MAVTRLSKRFGTNDVLKNVSFEVADGEFCILLGPSGCGKSTILRLIAGLEKATDGEIFIGGRRVDHLQPRERDIAFVFQSYALYPHMSVYQNLAFSLKLRGISQAEIATKVKETARLLEIDELLERRPQALSGGQRQRVALGRAIVRHPKVFLFDEPLSNLDASLRASMRVELARLHRRLGATVVYVTHDQAEALTLGQKIIVLHQGAIQQIGSASAIYHEPANRLVASFVGSPQMNFLEGSIDETGRYFQSEGRQLDIARLLGKPLPQLSNQPVTLGIRPEDLAPVDLNNGWICGKVELIEDLGADQFFHIQSAWAGLVARGSGGLGLRPGDTIGVNPEPSRIQFFREGKRIEPDRR